MLHRSLIISLHLMRLFRVDCGMTSNLLSGQRNPHSILRRRVQYMLVEDILN